MIRRGVLAGLFFVVAATITAAIVTSGRPQTHARSRGVAVAHVVPLEARVQSVQARDPLRRFLDRSSLRKRDDFVTPDGDQFTISEGRTADGARTCVVSAGMGAAGSACDANGFTASPVIWVESFSAGPDGKDTTSWQLSGLAGPQVARLVLVDSAGHDRPVHVGKGNAFFFAFSRGELKRGLSAQSLQVYDDSGKLIDEISLS